MPDDKTVVRSGIPAPEEHSPPRIPDHELLRCIGSGSYGEVWIARSVTQTLRAVKIVYRRNFQHARPFEREYAGLLKFEPISRTDEGFVDILHVGRNDEAGYFYYIMELGDDQRTGNEVEAGRYIPKTLSAEMTARGRFPADECISLGLSLSSALEYLHAHGLIHRDIKPSNIVFVSGAPKLADIGLVADVAEARSFVGTEGFIPPEGPGTAQADLYSLGKVLYEASTGKDRFDFPELPTNLGAEADTEKLLQLNEVILKACENDVRKRYKTAHNMHADLELLRQGKPLQLTESPSNNLPVQLTTFVGRESEMGEVKQLLATTRLLTLTGAGGCGKTRLALEVAASLVDEYADGAWLVELASRSDPASLAQAVTTALGIREQPSRTVLATLLDHLRSKHLLLVLDNCEHLISACATLAETLLKACPQLKLLATSREGLRAAGEVAWPVPSLSIPDPGQSSSTEQIVESEAVQLFVERARAVSPKFVVNDENARAIAQVCRRLDGIPLAIELAAARVKTLTGQQISGRLDDRFRLLTGGSRTALPRHQTLRAAIDWSHDLLTEPERALLRRLSVFVAGCTLEAAEAVCAGDGIDKHDVLDLITQLVDKSLLLAEERGSVAWYRSLETIRQYALDKLLDSGAAERVRAGHFQFYLQLAEQAEPQLRGAEQAVWLERLDLEHDNLRAALGWSQASAQAAESGLRLAVALWWFWWVRSYFAEGRHWLELSLERNSGAPAKLRAEALNGAGALANGQADHAATRNYYEQSLAIRRELGDKRGTAVSLNNLGLLAIDQCDYETARALLEEGLSIFRELPENKHAIAAFLSNLGLVAREQSDFARARTLFEKSLELRRGLGDQHGIAMSLYDLGIAAREQGRYTEARALLEEGLSVQRSLGDKRNATWSLIGLGDVAWSEGEYPTARSLYEESLAMFRQIGEKRGTAFALYRLGHVGRSLGDVAAARSLIEEGRLMFSELGDKAGIAMTTGNLGDLSRDEGNFEEARRLCRESLTLRLQLGNKQSLAESLESFAALALAENAARRATLLFGTAAAIRETIGTPLPVCERAAQEHNLANARAQLGEEPFVSAWTEGKAMPVEQAIALTASPIV